MSKVKTQIRTVDSRVYNYFSALYKCFYSPSLYLDVGKRWAGIGLIYLLLVVSIFSLVCAFKVIQNFSRQLDNDLIQPLKNLPLIYIQNGKVSIDKPTPYFIKNAQGKVVIIVDTTGKITNFPKEYPNLNILITKDSILVSYPTPQFLEGQTPTEPKKPNVQKFSKSLNTIFDGKRFASNKQITRLKLISQLLIYPLLLALLYGVIAVLFLCFSLMAQLFAWVFFQVELTYAKACRLLVVSATPMLSLLLVYVYFDLEFFGMRAIMFAVLFAYYSFAVYSLKKASQRLVL